MYLGYMWDGMLYGEERKISRTPLTKSVEYYFLPKQRELTRIYRIYSSLIMRP
jgi:hypothetical protein